MAFYLFFHPIFYLRMSGLNRLDFSSCFVFSFISFSNGLSSAANLRIFPIALVRSNEDIFNFHSDSNLLVSKKKNFPRVGGFHMHNKQELRIFLLSRISCEGLMGFVSYEI